METFDEVLDIAARHNIYLIPVLTDMCYNATSKEDYYEHLQYADLSSQTALTMRENIVKQLINRKNTVNGKLYKDDTTILAWDVANEPMLQWFSPLVVHNWLSQATSYVKSWIPTISSHLVLPIGREMYLTRIMLIIMRLTCPT